MEIQIHTPYITLGQLLKMADFIQSGGEAKFAVKELAIAVNGEQENRRGRKLYPNDVIVIEGKKITIK
ncbi:MAG: S4 domain-containing protein YaaA [Erysipelotrichaceae bacterium]